MRKLIMISGPDRIGKSTLCNSILQKCGKDQVDIVHLGEPPLDQVDPYDANRKEIKKWVNSGKEFCLFDRSYPCSLIFEEHRRGNAGHLSHIIDIEIELMRSSNLFKTIHVVYYRPWSWSSFHHLSEIEQLHPKASDWAIRDLYISRMKEHKLYYEKIRDFVENTTAFPTIWFEAGKSSADDAGLILQKLEEV